MPNEQKKGLHAQDEERVLEYWDKHAVFESSVERRPAEKSYVFYDGPPFATGLPHYGHIVASTMKDLAPRFWTMKGYRVERVWGWDCHGLPIENIVEKKYELGSRADIEKYGIAKFNDACHNEVLTYAEEWKKVIRRLGRWVDMENSYKTMDLSYMESIWWVFKQLWERGLIYEGHKPMHVCPRCETALSNFEVNLNYQDVTDISVFVSFPLLDGKYKGAKMVAWTTTPWTLPGNVLLAVGPEIPYVAVSAKHKETAAEETFIFGKPLWEKLSKDAEFGLNKSHDLGAVADVVAKDLVGSRYEPLFPFFADWENAFRVAAGEFVTTEDGTGIVHIAPGFGEDDMELGKKEGVKPLMHVKMNGQFVAEVVDGLKADGIDVAGKPVKIKGDTQATDIDIIKALAKRGRLLGKKKVTHSYPLCWRCDTPLLNYGTSSWFVNVTKIRERMVALNGGINWVPDNMKEGRFGKWLEGARDWAVSRSRFWGTPIPIWRAEDGETLCIGSVEELESLSGTKLADLHKHVVDPVTITHNGKEYRRVPEVLDCWFESGSMPYAQIHYPFENTEAFKGGFPAEFIAEGQDQTRGWFYTLHVLAAALFDSPAFKNVVVNGIVLAEDGKKMSKRLNNYPDPMYVIDRYGADAVRYYLMASPVVHAENLRFSETGVDEVSKKFVLILRNVLSFYQLYANEHDGRTPSGEALLDRWILARLYETHGEQTRALESYDFAVGARVLQEFVTDLSTWYVRRSRERVKEAGEDKLEALATLRYTLETFSKMLAPYMPFLAEMLYQELGGKFGAQDDRRLSVHLETWPTIDQKFADAMSIETMGRVRSIVSRALERRAEAGKNVRQVLAKMTVTLPGPSTSIEAYTDIVKDEVNVKEIVFQQGKDYAVELDLTMTPELVREGTAREIIRRVNAMRKNAGLTLEDRIDLWIDSAEPEVKKALEEHSETIVAGTLAKTLNHIQKPEVTETFRANEYDIELGFTI